MSQLLFCISSVACCPLADIENEDSEGKRKREAQRLMVCKEIISTEKSYVYNLTDMIQRFIRPLNANARSTRCCNDPLSLCLCSWLALLAPLCWLFLC
jgi:hypothetical protein